MIAPAHHPCPILETSLRKYNLAILKISRIIVPNHYPLTTNHYPLLPSISFRPSHSHAAPEIRSTTRHWRVSFETCLRRPLKLCHYPPSTTLTIHYST